MWLAEKSIDVMGKRSNGIGGMREAQFERTLLGRELADGE